MQALLELDCIPSGMELFPAANEDQWSLIKRVIDDCDYYIVIIAGRYGSIGATGISFTEMEYRYALEKGKPILAFLHEEPEKIAAEKYEKEKEKRQKLDEFRSFAKQKLVKFYNTPSELGSVVSRSLIRLIKDYPAIGWVKGDNLSSDAAKAEILTLKARVSELENQIAVSAAVKIEDYDTLAQGSDSFTIEARISVSNKDTPFRHEYYLWNAKTNWNEIFKNISPLLIDEAGSKEINDTLSAYILTNERQRIISNFEENKNIGSLSIKDQSIHQIVVQLFAIGLIEKGTKRRPINDKDTYYKLTQPGEKLMYQLRAIRKDASPSLFE